MVEEKLDEKKRSEDLIAEAKNFFNSYKKEIGKAVRAGKNIVYVDFNDIASFSHVLSEHLISNPDEVFQIMEIALEESGLIVSPRMRLSNLPEMQFIRIRNIRAKHLNQLISVEGIVRQASDVRPQVVNAKFECPSCGTIISVLQIEKRFREPSRCSCGRKGQFRLISKEMVDAQRIVIEESPESLVGGEQPRRISVFLKEDLVEPKMEEKTTPGSRVEVIGILKEVPVPLQTGAISTRFDLAIEANNITPLEETFEEFEINEEDERQILELAADKQVMQKMIGSIAPSIFGYDEIKQALVLQLFGGVKKKRVDGTDSRGDIHILLVGDPGVAKSILLKFISALAPKGRYVVGKGASAAGLTASVIRDEFLRGWALEAGAMVLSHKGLVAIDEIEKMDPEDRTAMHEALEQQCYLRDFKITLADGSKVKIGEFVDSLINKNKEKVQKGINCEILPLNEDIKILTTDFESIYSIKINRVSRHIAPKKFVKIKLNNGWGITVTPEHPCWTIKNSKLKTIPAESLRKSDFFPIPSEIPIEGEEQTLPFFKNSPQLCKVLGYHITDGCYELNRGKKNGIQFWNNDKKLIDDYFNSAKILFNLTPIITKRNNQFAVRIISKKVVEFFNSLDKSLMEKGKFKKIPEEIMKCKKEDITFLLRSLFDGDGTIVNVKRNGCRISLSCENIALAEQVSELLLRFGIISSIYKDREFFKIDICGQENLLKFYQNIGFLSEKKQNRLKEYLSKQKTYRSISDIVPVTENIKKIFKCLKINERKYLGNQICMSCNKHRVFLQKMVKIAEEKIDRLLEGKEIVNKTVDFKKLGEVRKKLEFSALSISKKLRISSYMLRQNEKRNKTDEKYKEILLLEIENMLSVLSELKEIKKLAFGKIRWAKIKSIETMENKDMNWVYDITVEPTHSFVSNNMILHNSVTISKANVQASLRAETSVLAAANPKFGRFEPFQVIAQQIDMPPTLLNRFDVIFTMRDIPERGRDEAIATHVLLEHKREGKKQVIDKELFRKYIAYAKQRISPMLTDAAVDEIKKFYVELRNAPVSAEGVVKPIPISARQLEAMIRLSEASARVRLSKKVTKEDAKLAIEIIKYYLMQVGFDQETKTFDIDRIATGVSTSQRGRIILVREALSRLEGRIGKLIPLEEIYKELEEKMSKEEIEDSLQKLKQTGDIFEPRKGYVQRV